MPHLVPLLGRNDLFLEVLRALRRLAPRVTGQIVDAMLDPATPSVLRRRLPRVLKASPTPRAVQGLVLALSDARFDVRAQVGQALVALTDKNPSLVVDREAIYTAVRRELAAEGEWGGDGEARGFEHVFGLLRSCWSASPSSTRSGPCAGTTRRSGARRSNTSTTSFRSRSGERSGRGSGSRAPPRAPPVRRASSSPTSARRRPSPGSGGPCVGAVRRPDVRANIRASQEASITDAPADRGFFGTLVGLWFEPGRTFEGIVRSPRIWVPLLAHFALVVVFSAIWLQKVDPGEFMKTQLVEQGRWDRMPPEARESVTSGSGGFFRAMVGVGALFGGLGFPFLVAGTLVFVFRFFYGSDVDFRRGLAVTVWSLLATGLVSTPILLLVLYLKGEWNLPPAGGLPGGPRPAGGARGDVATGVDAAPGPRPPLALDGHASRHRLRGGEPPLHRLGPLGGGGSVGARRPLPRGAGRVLSASLARSCRSGINCSSSPRP